MADERKFARLNESWQFTYRVLNEQEISEKLLLRFTVNISGGGICFRSSERLAPKTALAIEIDSEELPSPVIALASVVWCSPVEGEYEVGAEFWWIGWKDNDAQQSIANQISSVIETKREKERQSSIIHFDRPQK